MFYDAASAIFSEGGDHGTENLASKAGELLLRASAHPVAAASADHMACALRNWFSLSGRPRGTGKYHVTLWGWSEHREPDAKDFALMNRVALRVRQNAFKLRLDEVATFAQSAETPALVITGGDSVIGADRLQDKLGWEMRAEGFRGRRSSGRPHLTLLYDRFWTKTFRVQPLSWLVTDFALIRSVPLRPYEILGRWNLAGG